MLSDGFPVFPFTTLVNSTSDIPRDYLSAKQSYIENGARTKHYQQLKFPDAENYHNAIKVFINGEETRINSR